jgi:prolipoprotein diacylglyceryltransferase
MGSIHVYSLILAIGASFGLLWVMAASPKAQRLHWVIAGLAALLGAFIGARLGFVVEHLSYYSRNLLEIPQFWLGGLNWQGAVAGGLAVLPLISRKGDWPLSLAAERLSRLVLPLAVAGWIGLWSSGLGYGASLDENLFWGMAAADESGVVALRTPTQPMAILSLIVFLGVLELWLNLRDRPRLRAPLTFLIFSADMLLFSFLRADPVPPLFGLRIESWIAIIYTFAGIVSTIYVLRLSHPKNRLKMPVEAKEKQSHEIESRPGTD